MKKIMIASLFFCTSCIQSSLTYVKGKSPQPLFTIKQILTESGLMNPDNLEGREERPAPQTYAETNINNTPIRTLPITTQTIEAAPGSTFTLKVDTKNRLVAALFYSSAGFIHIRDQSSPAQGRFVFQAGNMPGEIRIRLYQKDGVLTSEERWFIEIR